MLNKRQFIFKFIYFFNVYGNILLSITIICIVLAIYFHNIYSFIFLASGLISCFFGIRITTRFSIKYKYYKVMHERILRNGYSIDCFEGGVMDPCFRLLTRQILFDINKVKDYKKIIACFGNTKRVIKYKSQKLIEELKAKDIKLAEEE